MRLDKTLRGEKDSRTPIWFMRQAGRYLPEYRELRTSEPDFIAYCLNSEKACKATLQPVQRYDIDAAIIFSDILMIPWALNADVHFIEGEGPKLRALEHPSDIATLKGDDMLEKLDPVFEALRQTRKNLDGDLNLIGFCGAPWTVSTYMIEGGGSRDFNKSREMLWQDRDGMMQLIGRLVDESIIYLSAKAEAGADTLMVFDSWANVVPAAFLEDIVIAPMRRIVTGLRKNGVTAPVIGFPRGIGEGIINYAEKSGVDAIGLDQGVDPVWADANLPKNLPVQGNLDPASLMEGGKAMLAAADKILDTFSSRPHIFNLGHGIGQFTPPEHITNLISHIRKAES